MPPWDAARAASRRPLPKPRKMHGPVGEAREFDDSSDRACCGQTCAHCGYHVCCCADGKPIHGQWWDLEPVVVLTAPYYMLQMTARPSKFREVPPDGSCGAAADPRVRADLSEPPCALMQCRDCVVLALVDLPLNECFRLESAGWLHMANHAAMVLTCPYHMEHR